MELALPSSSSHDTVLTSADFRNQLKPFTRERLTTELTGTTLILEFLRLIFDKTFKSSCICNSKSGSFKHKDPILYDALYMKIPRMGRSLELESQETVALRGGE
jgi:hypothetical protein